MNESRFDTIARCLARAQSRRRLLGGLSGSVVAVAGVIALPRLGRACRLAGQQCDAASPCCAGADCVDGLCRCAAGRRDCDGSGRCVNRATSRDHCGRCHNSCAARGTGWACCDGGCVDPDRDPANCGACGVACGESELCVRGVCLACPLGAAPCGTVCCRAPGVCENEVCIGGEAPGDVA